MTVWTGMRLLGAMSMALSAMGEGDKPFAITWTIILGIAMLIEINAI